MGVNTDPLVVLREVVMTEKWSIQTHSFTKMANKRREENNNSLRKRLT